MNDFERLITAVSRHKHVKHICTVKGQSSFVQLVSSNLVA